MASDSESVQLQLAQFGAAAVNRCARVWGEPDLASRLTFSVGERLRGSLGRCYPERGLVRIARFALDLPAELRDEIICHEAAHMVVFERHGRSRRPHGVEWKDLMRSVGLIPRVRIQLEQPALLLSARSPSARVLFEHRCPVCHAARIARRRVSRWRCRSCVEAGLAGALEVSRRTVSELSL